MPEFDWKIEYIKVNDNEFYSHYLKSGFMRDKTLGDGDEMCNNKFYINGQCEWVPEKGFEYRK